MNDELYHHGILGMHWGVRRYQNPDGSLTEAGKARLRKTTKFEEKFRFANQRKEIEKYSENFNDEGRINGYDLHSFKGATDGDKKALDNLKEYDEKTIKLFNDHLYKMKEAKIKDLKIKNTKQVQEYINELIEDDKLKMYTTTRNEKPTYTVLSKKDIEKYADTGMDVSKFVDIDKRKKQINDSIKENKNVRKDLLKKKNLTDDDKEIIELMDMDDKDKKKELKELNSLRKYPINNKSSIKASKISDSEKSKLLQNAKKNDKWNVKFLEMVQNKKVYNNPSKLLKEYEKYLDDPSEYKWQVYKLEDE